MVRLSAVSIMVAGLVALLWARGHDVSLLAMQVTEFAGLTIESWRVVGGVIGVAGVLLGALMSLVGIVAYAKSLAKTRASDALQATVDIYKQQIDAQRLASEQQRSGYQALLLTNQEQQKEMLLLRAKTDLTEVLFAMREITTAMMENRQSSKAHDETIVDMLASFMKQSGDGMELLTGVIQPIGVSVTSLLKSVDGLTRRLGRVEGQMDDIAEHVGADGESKPYDGDDRRKPKR